MTPNPIIADKRFTPKSFGFNTHGDIIQASIDKSNKRNITIIAAVASNGGIGNRNDIPWKLPPDMKQFKRLTTGHAVIMGRMTQESLPGQGYLPSRLNIVVSKSGNVKNPMVQVVGSLEEAIELAGDRQIFIIGGSELYKAAIPIADDMIITKLMDFNPAFDRSFPAIDETQWGDIAYCEHTSHTLEATIKYRYCYYTRKPK